MNSNNPRHKLNEVQVEKAREFYEDQGWKILWIAAFFHVRNGAVHFHVKSRGWVRKIRVLKRMPDEVAEMYRDRKKQKYDEEVKGSYTHIKNLDEFRRNENCGHARRIKRCSLCGEIIGSDSIEYCQAHSIIN